MPRRIRRDERRRRRAHRIDVLHLPRGVMQEREGARLDQHVVVVRRAAQEGRADGGHLVAHAEAEAIDEEAARGRRVGRGRDDVREPVRPRRLGARDGRARARVDARRAPGSVGRELRLRLLRQARLDRQGHADAGGRLARVERVALAPRAEAQPVERCGRPAEVVGVVDADRQREERAARRRDERELLAAVARREAARRDLREPELPVEGARRVEHAAGTPTSMWDRRWRDISSPSRGSA